MKGYTTTKAVALRIVELLNKQDISQYELSKRADIDQSTISYILKERNNTCKLNVIEKIAFGFGMNLSQFFDSDYFVHDKFLR